MPSNQMVWDSRVIDAGVENMGAFCANVEMMFNQELDALRCAAMEGAGARIQCPYCYQFIERVTVCDLCLDTTRLPPKRFYLTFMCPHCKETVGMDIVPADVYKLPF